MKKQYSILIYLLLFSAYLSSQCLSPSSVTVSSIDNDGATFSWVDFSGSTLFDLEIEPLTGGTSDFISSVTSPYTWNGGAPGEVYNVLVRSHCPPPNAGTFSNYAAPVYFQVEPLNCVEHTIFNPPLEYTTGAGDCDQVSDDIDLNGDGTDDLFIIIFDACVDPFYYTNSASSVRLTGLNAEGIQFSSNQLFVTDNGIQTLINGLTPLGLGFTILTTEISGVADIANHGNDYSAWEGAGIKYIGFDLIKDGFKHNGWIKAEADDQYLKIYEIGYDNRIDNVMQAGQISCEYCPADFDADGIVEIDDFLSLNSLYNSTCTCPEDLDGNGIVNVDDFIDFNSWFGTDCSTLLAEGEYRTNEFLDALEDIDEEKIHPEIAKVIDEMRKDQLITVFPNPSEGEFVSFKADFLQDVTSDVNVIVTDVTGKKMYSRVLGAESIQNNIRLDFENSLTPGVYLLQLGLNNAVFSQRFVVH